MFGVFLIEFFAFRIGMNRLERMGINLDPHVTAVTGGHHGAHEHRPVDTEPVSRAESGMNGAHEKKGLMEADLNEVSAEEAMAREHPMAQILGVSILEFGVIFHSCVVDPALT